MRRTFLLGLLGAALGRNGIAQKQLTVEDYLRDSITGSGMLARSPDLQRLTEELAAGPWFDEIAKLLGADSTTARHKLAIHLVSSWLGGKGWQRA